MGSARRMLAEALPAGQVLAFLFVSFQVLRLLTASSTPLLMVYSGSMEPAFYPGDIILLWNRQSIVQVGDIPVIWFEGRPMPMVHRAVTVAWEQTSSGNSIRAEWAPLGWRQLILTKGDNNELNDVTLYPEERHWVYREEIVGVVRGHIPYLGRATIWWRRWWSSSK